MWCGQSTLAQPVGQSVPARSPRTRRASAHDAEPVSVRQSRQPPFLRNHLFTVWSALGVLGRIYVSGEGINAQLSLPTQQTRCVQESSCEDIDWLNKASASTSPLKVTPKSFPQAHRQGPRQDRRRRPQDDAAFDVTDCGQPRLRCKEFNALADASRNRHVVDMRNHYESEVGHFKGAVLPAAEHLSRRNPRGRSRCSPIKKDQNILCCTALAASAAKKPALT